MGYTQAAKATLLLCLRMACELYRFGAAAFGLERVGGQSPCAYRRARSPDTCRSPLGRACAASARRARRHLPDRCDPDLEFPGRVAGIPGHPDVIAWIVWACFAVDYVARLLLSVEKARFVRTHKLDLLMVLLPMLRLLRIFLLLRRSLASVSTERIAGSILSIVVAAVFVSAFFMWRVEYDAPGATITTFRYALWWASSPPRPWATATTPRSRPRAV